MELDPMKSIFLIGALVLSFAITAQNLAVNGSFENTGNCPILSNDFEDFLAPWTFFGSRPDYYHPCGFPGSDSATNNTLPFDGQGFVGLQVYGELSPGSGSGFVRRDYIHGELSEPLDSGEFYRISFYVKPVNRDVDSVSYGIDNIGLLFTDTVLDTASLTGLLEYEPDVRAQQVITQTNYWTQVCAIYKARGGEEFFTIGNFFADANTSALPLENATQPFFGYMLVDYVEITENDIPELPQDTILCEEDRIDLVISGPDISVTWSDESTGDTLIVTEPGTYFAQITEGECTYVDSVQITEVFCEFCEVYIPKAFTPNDDGLNETFSVIPNCQTEGELIRFSIRIFDRWGQKVFESEDPDVAWGGGGWSQGVYTYTVEYTYSSFEETTTRVQRGSLTLIR